MWRMLCPTYRRVRCSRAARSTASQSAVVVASGFSQKVGTPAASVASATGACRSSGVRTITESSPRPSSASRSGTTASDPSVSSASRAAS